MTVLNDDRRDVQGYGLSDDAVVVKPLVPQPGLDAPYQQPEFPHVCQKLTAELIAVTIVRGKSGHPDLGTEELMVGGGIVMDAEQEVRVHGFGEGRPLL